MSNMKFSSLYLELFLIYMATPIDLTNFAQLDVAIWSIKGSLKISEIEVLNPVYAEFQFPKENFEHTLFLASVIEQYCATSTLESYVEEAEAIG